MSRRLQRPFRLAVGLSAATLASGLASGLVCGAAGLATVGEPFRTTSNGAMIFGHNATIALVLMAGAASLGIVTVIQQLVSGWLIGTQIAVSITTFGWAHTAAGLAAHGPTEVVGFLLAGAVGLLPLVLLARNVSSPDGGRPRAAWRHDVRLASGFAVLSLVLLALSAGLEARITPILL